MPRYFLWSLAVSAIIVIVLCTYKTSPDAEQATRRAELGGASLSIEYATTDAAREKGLGGRESIAIDYGMLFVFPKDDYHGFWMKDMKIPVDIFWLDADGRIVSIMQDVATSSYPNVFYPTVPARYALETAAGFVREHNIATGTSLLLKDFSNVSE